MATARQRQQRGDKIVFRKKPGRARPVQPASSPAYDWRREQDAAMKRYKAEQDARERAVKEAAAQKLAVHMSKSPQTRAMEAQLLGEKIGEQSVNFYPEEEAEACVRRMCLEAQRKALRTVKERLLRWRDESEGRFPPVDAMERRAFMRGAWWSIKEKLDPVCRPRAAGDEDALDGLRRRNRKGRR